MSKLIYLSLIFSLMLFCKQNAVKERSGGGGGSGGGSGSGSGSGSSTSGSGSSADVSDDDLEALEKLNISIVINDKPENKFCIELEEKYGFVNFENVFLCTDQDIGLKLSNNGPIDDMECMQIIDKEAETKDYDNYICIKEDTDHCLRTYDKGDDLKISDKLTCVAFDFTSSNRESWNDNVFCALKTPEDFCPSKPDVVSKGEGTMDYTEIDGMKWLYKSTHSAPASYTCINIYESYDPDVWRDNFLCFDKNYNVNWTKSGRGNFTDKYCTNIISNGYKDNENWHNNYLCQDTETNKLCLQFSNTGAIKDMDCVQMLEPDDKNWGTDNYICKPKSGQECPAEDQISTTGAKFNLLPGLMYKNTLNVPPEGKYCINLKEDGDPRTWQDNWICMDQEPDPKITWSAAGRKDGQNCTKVYDPSDSNSAAWLDNYLCASSDKFCMRWSYEGPIPDMDCLKIKEDFCLGADPGSCNDAKVWDNNYLCVRKEEGGYCPDN